MKNKARNIRYDLGVLGAGSWGTALAIACARNQHPVCLWGHQARFVEQLQKKRQNETYLPGIVFPDPLAIIADLNTVISASRHILISIPSHAFSDVLQQIQPFLSSDQGLLIATKGLEPTNHQLLHEVVMNSLSDDIALAVLSGPSFAKEVAIGLPTAVTIAHYANEKSPTFAKTMAQLFHSDIFRVYQNNDIVGVEVAAGVKYVLAIATGISDGLGFGANARAALITRGLQEMIRLGTALGAQTKTFMGLAGMGDLVLTCTDDQSRNRRFGLALGQGLSQKQASEQINQVVEGYQNAKAIYDLSRQRHIDMPIVEEVHAILYHNKLAKDAVTSLMQRTPKTEL